MIFFLANKDIAPRFKKNFNLLAQGPEEVQMRPAANSLLYKANNIKTTQPPPSMLPLGGPTNRNSHHTPSMYKINSDPNLMFSILNFVAFLSSLSQK